MSIPFRTTTPATFSSRPESRLSNDVPVRSIILPNNLDHSLARVVVDHPSGINTPSTTTLPSIPEEWTDIDPDCVISRMKELNPSSIGSNEKPFYKSYSTWNKLSIEQRNKATAWFRKLEQSTRREFILILFYFYY